MATWKDIGVQNLEAAKMMLAAKKFRSTASRAYYAAFSITNEVLDRGGFLSGLRTPSHRTMPRLIEHTFVHLTMPKRRKLMADYRELYRLRIGADYERGYTVDRQAGLRAVRLAGFILKGCGL
jgi:uncharacterized protein (UPF0332 family)